MIVMQLNATLPERYVAGPLVHLGSEVEIDDYEVQVIDRKHQRWLVAVIELVSPSNKDRPETRQIFTAKCEALLRKGVSVAIVDVVTSRTANLYGEMLELVGQRDEPFGATIPTTYAAACRWIARGRKHVLESWSYPLSVGQPLPTPPLWLAENFAMPLDLETSYQATCQVLRIAEEVRNLE
jgi:hypothetical protein